MGSKPGSALEQGDIIMLTVAGGDTVNITVTSPLAHFGSYLDDRDWAEFEAVREDNGMSGRIRYQPGDSYQVIGKCAHVCAYRDYRNIQRCDDCGTILNERSSSRASFTEADRVRALEAELDRSSTVIREKDKRITELSAEASTARIARRSAENKLLRERGEKQLAELRLQRDEARNARNTRDQELQNVLRQRDAAREAWAWLRKENARLDGLLGNRSDRIRVLEQAIRTAQGVL